MKKLILVLILLISPLAIAGDLGEKFCEDKARVYFLGYHHRVLDEAGVIQGYYEDISLDYSQKINDMDQRDETYHFSVTAGNDEGDYWIWEYVVNVEAWLAAGGKAHTCTIIGSLKFLSVTESHVN